MNTILKYLIAFSLYLIAFYLPHQSEINATMGNFKVEECRKVQEQILHNKPSMQLGKSVNNKTSKDLNVLSISCG